MLFSIDVLFSSIMQFLTMLKMKRKQIIFLYPINETLKKCCGKVDQTVKKKNYTMRFFFNVNLHTCNSEIIYCATLKKKNK